MTEKKELILQAALQLFSIKGFHATSTNKIAKTAKVSEGLIFKHFGNKEGLLNAIIKEGEERAKAYFETIITESDPKMVIQKMIDLPFSVLDVSEQEFWRLQFKLKWELKQYDDSKMDVLEKALCTAFKKLNYPNPALEAQFLKHYCDGLAGAILKGLVNNPAAIRNFLIEKYKLN